MSPETEPHATKRPVAAHMYAWAGARITLALIFLWAFFDKTIGLGYTTKAAGAWMNGGSPTNGFLSHTSGPLSGAFKAIAGNVVADWLFMAALLGIGLALLLGIGMRVAAASGAFLMLAMYAAGTLGVAGTNNPIVDDHIVYAFVLVGLALVGAGRVIGLGAWWERLALVQKYPFLK